MRNFKLVTLVSAIAFSNPALADLMYCGERLITAGNSAYEVLQKCGQPSYKQDNKWFYEQSAGQFVKILTIENGKVAFIKEGEKQE